MTRYKRFAIGLLALLLAATPGLVAYACGGFFGPQGMTVYLDAFRIAFGITADHQVTEVVDVQYTGSAQDFSWIMPLPAVPTVDVAQQNTFDILQYITDPTVSYPVDYCKAMNQPPDLVPMGGGGGLAFMGEIGPYDYAIIKNDKPDELVSWLRSNGFTVKSSDLPMIAQYVKEGNTFVAMHLKPGQDIQAIQPVVFHYKSSRITIPVRMGAAASKTNVPILAWFFADSQYAPTNYARVNMPALSKARAQNEVLDMGWMMPGQQSLVFHSFPGQEYADGVTAIQKKHQGHAFITEEAIKTADFNVPVPGSLDPVVQDMITQFPYMTRLSAALATNQMNLDPLFAPVSGLPDVSNIDLSEQVDPLAMYGCTTHEALDSRIAKAFAINHTTFPGLHFDVGHPADWTLSQFTVPVTDRLFHPGTIYVYSPQPVTAQTVNSYFSGGATPPMFVFTPRTYDSAISFENDLYTDPNGSNPYRDFNYLNPLLISLGRKVSSDKIYDPTPIGPYRNDAWAFQDRPVSYSFEPIRADGIDRVVLFGILASPAQWQSNQGLFDDMLAYARAHQYYTSAANRDTLFLKIQTNNKDLSGTSSDIYTLPIPDGWTAHMDTNQDILIDSGKGDGGPAIRLTPVGSTAPSSLGQSDGGLVAAAQVDLDNYSYPTDTIQRALMFYGLPGSPSDPAIMAATQKCALGNAPLKAAAFSSGGRTGLVLMTNEYIVGVYAPDAEYAANQAQLQQMMDAYIDGYQCGIARPQPTATAMPATTPTAVPVVVTSAPRTLCPNAPPSRLTVGGFGRVTPGTSDNVRAAPNTTANILAQASPGDTFKVIRGPVCDSANGLAWWQVNYNNVLGWIAEGHGGDYFIQPF